MSIDLAGVRHKITGPLMAEEVPHEVIGGLAVLIHVEEADPAQSALTRDVDLMIRRSDLERVVEIAARHGSGFVMRLGWTCSSTATPIAQKKPFA